MTNTFTTLVSLRSANPRLPIMIQLGATVNGLFIWNFEFRSLGFACYLDFGTWNFHDFNKLIIVNQFGYPLTRHVPSGANPIVEMKSLRGKPRSIMFLGFK